MREIKFRGWHERLKIWAYGCYTHSGKTHLIHVDKEYHTGTVTHGGAYEVDPDTVGQFTGLTDANGQEIYEGDIVKVIDRDCSISQGNFIVCIKWGYASYELESHGHFADRSRQWMQETAWPDEESGYSWYVIGNIYDNPELLEARA